MVSVHVDTETHPQHLGFAGSQTGQHFAGGVAQALAGRRIRRQGQGGIFDEVAQVGIFIITYGRLHGDGLLGDFQYLADLVFRHAHAHGQLFRVRFTTHLLQHLTGDTVELVDGLDHVHRDTDGTGLIRDGAGNGLTDPPGSVSRELVATTVFKLVHRLHQTYVALLDQIQELQTAVGVLLGDRDNQTQVGLDHLFLRTAGLGLTNAHATVDVLDLGDRQTCLFFDLLQLADGTQHFFVHLDQTRRPGLASLFLVFKPGSFALVVGEGRDEGLLRHLGLLNAELHDDAFLHANPLHHLPHVVDQAIELLGHQAELTEHIGQLGDGSLGVVVGATILLDGETGDFVLGTQFTELLAGDFRIRTTVSIVVGAVAVFVFILVFIFVFVSEIVFTEFGADVSGGRRHVVRFVRIDKAGDDVGQTQLLGFVLVVLFEQVSDGFRVLGNGALYLVDTVLDPFGDVDFAFTGQQFDGTHFPHVHADGIGRATNLRFNRCQSLGRCFGSVLIGGTTFGHDQIIGVRGVFHYLDTHIVDHLDDVFDLVRVDNVLREVIVHLGIGQVALFFTFGNEEFKLRLRGLLHRTHPVGVARLRVQCAAAQIANSNRKPPDMLCLVAASVMRNPCPQYCRGQAVIKCLLLIPSIRATVFILGLITQISSPALISFLNLYLSDQHHQLLCFLRA